MDTRRATEGSAGVLNSTSRSPSERNAVDMPGSDAVIESWREMRASYLSVSGSQALCAVVQTLQPATNSGMLTKLKRSQFVSVRCRHWRIPTLHPLNEQAQASTWKRHARDRVHSRSCGTAIWSRCCKSCRMSFLDEKRKILW